MRGFIRSIFFSSVLFCSLSACEGLKSHEYEFIDSVPVQSLAIINADLDALLKMAGCNSVNGSITLTENIKTILGKDSLFLSVCSAQGNWIDLSDTYLYVYSKDTPPVFTAKRKHDIDNPYSDNDKKHKSESIGSFDYLPMAHGISLAANDDQVWIAPTRASEITLLIDSLTAIAHADPLSAGTYKNLLHRGDAQAVAIMKIDALENPFGENFDRANLWINCSDRIISLQAKASLHGTWVDAFADMPPLDPIAFDNMPMGTALAAAIGLGETSMEKLPNMFRRLSTKNKMIANIAWDLLNPYGGTMGIAVAPGGNAETLRRMKRDNWMIRVIIPTAEKGDGAADIINYYADENVYAEADSCYTRIWNYDPFFYSYYYKRSIDIEPEYENGASGAAFINVPYRSELMKAARIKNGYQAQLQICDSCFNASVRVLGTSTYILPAIVNDAARLKKTKR